MEADATPRRRVFYDGDSVNEHMKVLPDNGQEIRISVFRNRETNQPVVTSIWKRRRR